MKKILFSLAWVILLTQGCQTGQKKALQYNNKIANISVVNQDKWKQVGEEINVARTSHEFTKLTALTNELVDFLANKLTEVNAMESPPGAEDLKAAMIEFLQFEKKTADETLIPYTKMNKETSNEEFQTATQGLLDAAKNEEPYLTKLQDAQRVFAQKNGFKIQENKKE